MTETLSRADVERAEMYSASVGRYAEGLQLEARAEWIRYHLAQAERLESTAAVLAAEHRARAETLKEGS